MPDAAPVALGAFLTLLCLVGSGLAAVALQRLALLPAQDAASLRLCFTGPEPVRPIKRAGEALAALAGALPACLCLLITARPVMSALLCLSLWLLLLVLNTAKTRILHEPLVLADAWLLKQVARYPEMYFPFLPMKRIFLAFGILCCILAALWFLEPAVPPLRRPPVQAALALAFLAPLIALALMRLGRLPRMARFLLRHCPVSHDATQDSRMNGALASALLHPIWAGLFEHQDSAMDRDPASALAGEYWPPAFIAKLGELDAPDLAALPHVALIQAESFCDIREHLLGEQRRALAAFLPHWDALRRAGQTLPTPENAFGAYTMRTEFSTLTGLRLSELGPWAFNPYLLAARRPLWSLARYFAEKGYETICLHPYHKDFFRRDKVMRNLGFHRFLGIEELGGLAHFGPHVSDTALGGCLMDILAQSAGPVFSFVITMEAHSPWLPGRLSEEQIAQTLPDIDRSLFRMDMLLYLCHLRHMDHLFGLLGSANGASRPTRVFAYGDHAPGLDMGEAARVGS